MSRNTQSSASRGRTALSQLLLPCALMCVTTLISGCKSNAGPKDDATLASAVSAGISSDASLSGQPIQASVQGGVVTLGGGVLNDAQRTIAARDAAGIPGVKEVINNLTLGSAAISTTARKPSPGATVLPSRDRLVSRSDNPPPAAPIQRLEPSQTSHSTNDSFPPPPAPRTPPPPSFRTVNVPVGTSLPIRVTQTLDSATTQPGDNFSGVTASDIIIDGLVAIPAGSAVTGNVDAVQEAAHFKGNSLLTVSLTGLKDRGERVPLSSDPYTVTGKGRGKNTAEKAGGGAAVGAILGGIFGGGKGAAIGAAAGGGAGAGVNAVTRGQQVQIPSETVVRFQTSSAITVHVRTADTSDNSSTPDLQHRPE